MKIIKSNCNFEQEPLSAPFGFKGGYMNEIWQSVVLMESASGNKGVGLGAQSVLWSDAQIFTKYSESEGNKMMFQITSYAAKMAMDFQWQTPLNLLDQLLPITYEFAQKITKNPDLRLTFALNALVAVDNAAWVLYCRENNIDNFEGIIPDDIKPALSYRHEKIAGFPLMSYNVPLEEIIQAINDGYFFLKIKIGADPDKDGDLDKMLAWDKNRLNEIHQAVKDIKTPYTDNGYIPYYFDANGRYDTKERLMKFLDYAKGIGALDRIAIIEEPFPEEYKENVSDIPVRLAADESAHSDKDVIERIDLGYKAIALKPIAKTMSMSLRIAKIAYQKNIPCFCADLTVNPILVDWNKNVAARLSPLPGLKIGVVESNGHQNYKRWDQMCSYHPYAGASWTKVKKGLFYLDDDFYNKSGGILEDLVHYQGLVK
ncbi:MAG: L-alanine-DL-glutamate epimerase [Candidatus Omnitrophica bacterium]|nr:L-alanine-DL-glutamate epimerase [Candidatus Omnitrophota bacterium]